MAKVDDYLDFLKYCLDTENRQVPACAATINWDELLVFARKQSIVGIFWDGIRNVFKQAELHRDEELMARILENKINEKQTLDWMAKVKGIQLRNEKVNAFAAKATSNFALEGFRTCILKGQSNALRYPDPSLRSCGDIDIWTEGGRWKAFCYVRRMFPKAKFKCQHIEFPVKAKIPVEVHFYPMYLENLWCNRKLQKFFKQQADEQFSNWKQLPGNAGKICTPTPFFDAIYQLTHINVHILIEGIGLRQFIDYYYVLRYLPKEKHEEVRQLLKSMNLTKLAAATTWIVKEVLGLPEEYCYIQPDERRGKHLMMEIERGGNFGKFNDEKPKNKNALVQFWQVQMWKLGRNARYAIDYPSEELSEPIFRIIHWIWRQWYQMKWLVAKK